MTAPMRFDNVGDFVKTLLPFFERDNYVDISVSRVNYPGIALLFKGKLGGDSKEQLHGQNASFNRKGVASGGSYTWMVKVGANDNFGWTSMWEPDPIVGTGDMFQQATVPFAFFRDAWPMDAREPIWDKGKEAIIDVLKARDYDCQLNVAEKIETAFWTAPTDSNTKQMLGLPFWIQKDTSTTGAFKGGNPTGFSAGAAGLSSTTYPNWQNWAGSYVNVQADDLITGLSKAMFNTNFNAPAAYPDLLEKLTRVLFTTFSTYEGCRRLYEQRNDNLGYELIAGDRRIVVASAPMLPVAYLTDNDTKNPVYGVDTGSVGVVVNPGWDMKRSVHNTNTHTVMNTWIDGQVQLVFHNRRSSFVLSQA